MWQNVAVPILGLACAVLAFFQYDAHSRIDSYLKEEIRQAERRAREAESYALSKQGFAIGVLEGQNDCLHDPYCRVVVEEYRGSHKVRVVKCSSCGRQLSVTWPEDEEA